MTLDKIKSIHLASDHAGFAHKEEIVKWLKGSVYNIIDHGAKDMHPLDDFTDFISLASQAVSNNPEEACGIVFGGSGQGEAMLANRYPNVRAVVFYGGDKEIIRLSREHNDSNIISFGARFVSVEEVKSGIITWLSTPALEEDKYQRRNKKIESIIDKLNKS